MDSVKSARFKRHAPRWALDTADIATRAMALATVGDRPFPDFLVIGTKRGGTTSLFNYLTQHPGILGMYPQLRGKKSTDFYFADNTQSQLWYKSHFHTETYRKVLGRKLGHRPLSLEASPYYIWDPRIPVAVSKLAPSTRAIVLLRDPIKRAWSHYQERFQNGVESLPFDQALEAEDQRLAGELDKMLNDHTYHSNAWDWYSYRSRGEYLNQIKTWEQHFPREQLLVLFSEDLYANTQGTVDRVCTFLDIPTFSLPTTRTYNATWRTTARAPKDESAWLREHYSPINDALATHLGQPLPWE
ncbi:sulfotransferase family protein [Ornithinimicrobium faecis]|uniref:sulfotransferase family protein n=1 Tax=Ornithinimicrobium faecis TaxID=2934158 RepID=UPI0021187E02|nr:sulfotransferase domain-containing protein [Ornithinimicrobium sp. HY1745]